MVERLFLAVPWVCLRFVIVIFPDHTHLLFLTAGNCSKNWTPGGKSIMTARDRSVGLQGA